MSPSDGSRVEDGDTPGATDGVAPGTAGVTGAASPSLRRDLGRFEVVVYGVGLILGAGIYAILGAAAGVAGESVPLAFLLAAVVASATNYWESTSRRSSTSRSPPPRMPRTRLGPSPARSCSPLSSHRPRRAH
ncbi:hypothetical protein [Halobaculum gomorrense]|uniref:hypothetical protein n=1 Tax=Halobaculum gomorrense TaxID=43928 RepID=UPI0009346A63|nr:hypothetical protein [Halobaculum gomorrense]